MEERVLDHIDKGEGVRQVEGELNVLHMTIWRIPHEHLLYLEFTSAGSLAC
jgi:hypothetical protein